jgi:hypothetical protein
MFAVSLYPRFKSLQVGLRRSDRLNSIIDYSAYCEFEFIWYSQRSQFSRDP